MDNSQKELQHSNFYLKLTTNETHLHDVTNDTKLSIVK